MRDKKSLSNISVVIPCLNEESAIGQTIDNIITVFDQADILDYEIVVVDDGSTDKTAEIALSKNATVISHPHNLGYGNSLKDGIKAARYNTIVISDADGTYPIDDIPSLFRRYSEGYDMVVGERTGEHLHESIYKSPLRKILRWLVEFASGRVIPDINSGLRIFDKRTVVPFYNHLCDTFSFTTSLTLAYMMTNKTILYVPIEYFERIGNTKVRLFKDSVRTLIYIVQSILYYNPLKIFMVLCGFSISLSIASIFIGIIWQIRSGFMLGVGGLLCALIIFSMGLLADLLKQIMNKQ